MNRIHPEFLDPDSSDRSTASDFLLREQPDEEDEEEEDEDEDKRDEDDHHDDDGYSVNWG